MIGELLAFISTKTSSEARIFGHLYESIALLSREKRCQSFWLPHRDSCKKSILKIESRLSKKESALVLGSGPLHEIPLEEMAATFKRVDLVDIVHLKKTKDKYKHLSNVFFIEADITALEKTIHQEKKTINIVPDLFLDHSYDLVISANVLTQLCIHLRNYLKKKAKPKLSESELDLFSYQVSSDHYQYLRHFKCPVILICDTETQFVGAAGDILDVSAPYINFELPGPMDSWWWNLAPRPEVSKDYSVRMKVSVFILNYSSNATLIKT